jgi:hypothetical protein
MKRIPEDVLADLVMRMTLADIARMFGCDPRTVSLQADRQGLVSPFARKDGTAEEFARIRELLAAGWPHQRIAQDLGRSHDFVVRHVRRLEAGTPPPKPLESGLRPLKPKWPVPDATWEEALKGRTYDDISETTICREWPPWRLPVNGAALASAAQAANRTYTRSAADLCVDEARD